MKHKYEVSVARDYEDARSQIVRAEEEGNSFDALDLNVSDENEFWDFVSWMEDTGRTYPFSVFGCNTFKFVKIRVIVRSRGFHFND